MTGKLIIFSAPSGSGKSTIINYLLTQNLNLAFSISATSRPPRGTEQHGVEYFFLTPEEFRCDGLGSMYYLYISDHIPCVHRNRWQCLGIRHRLSALRQSMC